MSNFKDPKLSLLEAVFISASIFTLLGCSGSMKWVERIEREDFSDVVRGRVPYATRKVDSPSEYDGLIQEIMGKIEENAEALKKIASHFFPEMSKNLDFQFDFSSLDEKKEKLILRFFAKMPDSKVYAGIALQFVVDVKREEVSKIYAVILPLE